MRELPACFADHLHHSGRHACQQIGQAQLPADDFGLLQVRCTEVSPPAHKQIECECFGENVVLMELRRGGDALAPTFRPERVQAKTVEERVSGEPSNSGRLADRYRTETRSQATAAPATCHAPAVSRFSAR